MAKREQVRVRPKRSLGQNFLVDDNIGNKIIREFRAQEDDAIIEIGPGEGALTQKLAARASHLLLVEIDGRMIETLKNKFQRPHITVLHGDFMEIDLMQWHKLWNARLRIVGNLPYHMTSPILFKVFEAADAVQDVTIMVQREVGRRITAAPGTKEYGILAVLTHYHGKADFLFSVSPSCFYPRPKVTSAVIQIRMKEPSHASKRDFVFRRVVRTTFGKRRKTLRKSLCYFPLTPEDISDLERRISVSLDRRPEELTVDQFLEISRQLEGRIS